MHKETHKIKSIAFLGGAFIEPDSRIFVEAYETAKLLAQNGYNIVNGGGPGVMRASTMGAHDGGSTNVLAVTYTPQVKHLHYEGIDKENKFDQEIVTLDYFDRTKVMLLNSDVHILFKGSSGTISEFGMSWANSRIHEGHHKPGILFGSFWHEIIDTFKQNMLMRPGEVELLKVCTNPQQVLDYLKELEHTKLFDLRAIEE